MIPAGEPQRITFRLIDQIGLGWLSMHPDQLAGYTLRELFRKVDGFNQVRQADHQNRFEAARLTAWMVICSISGKSSSPQSMVRFAWERRKTSSKQSAAERKEILDQMIKKWHIN